ncbi:MAG TPA: glutamine synthetase family protein [Pseudomonadales bacterium]
MNEDLVIAERFLSENPDIEVIEALLVDINGVHRGKWIPRHRLPAVFAGEFRLPLTTVAADIWGRDVPALCAKTGDGDGIAVPTPGTLKRLPWLDRPTAQVYLHLTLNGEPWGYDPRAVLAGIVEQFAARKLTPVVAPELEFMLLAAERGEDGVPGLPSGRFNRGAGVGGQLMSMDAMHEFADFLHDAREVCDSMELGLETIVKELAPGQFELNLHHVGDALRAADNAQMLKRALKGVARRYGYLSTFMAKPFPDLDGNGFHTHVSVLDEDGRNIFDDGTDEGSPRLRHAIAGLAASMPDLMLVFAPHRNSYRRFASGTHVAQAPTWAFDDRYVALRVPEGPPGSRRIEHRVAGADANPHLVLAAILAGILHGLENELKAPEPTDDAIEGQEQVLAQDWLSATRAFEESEFVSKYLGAPFKEAMLAIKSCEQEEFSRTITAFEYDTYLLSS